MNQLIIETSRTGHSVYIRSGNVEKYLGPIAFCRAPTPIDAIPRAQYRAAVFGWKSVSPDVELRTYR